MLKLGLVIVIGLWAAHVAILTFWTREVAKINDRVADSIERLPRLIEISSHGDDADGPPPGPLFTNLTERDQLTWRTAESAALLRETPISYVVTTLLALVLVIGVYPLLVRLVNNRERDEPSLIEQAQRWQAHTRRLQELARLSTQLHRARDLETILKIIATESRNLLGVQKVETTTEPFAGESACACAGAGTGVGAETPTAGVIELPITGRDGQDLAHLRVTLGQSRELDDRDRAILDQLVQMASVAIENARLYQELRENDHSKDRFLAMLSHELRNPVAAISSAVTLGRDNDRRDDGTRLIDVIERQVHRLTQLIDDLMDVSRITQGKVRLRWGPVDVGAIAASAIEAARPLLEQRKHTLETAIPSHTFWVNGDSTRLEQIFTNLLNNAAKYTPSGGRIALTMARDGDEVVVRFRDSGVGIAPDLLPRIFDLFTQGDRSLARSEGGLGIGLTLVKTLTELHGGSVCAASDGPDAGSEFMVRLPAIRKPLIPAPKRQPGDRPDPPPRPLRVLVVDDHIDLAHGLSQLIGRLGHQVQAVNDGPTALESARAFRPEVVLLDIGLPGMDGYEVASRLRSQAGARSLVLVAITGYGQEEDRRRSHEAGFDFHLVKPIDLEILKRILNRITPARSPS
jgi:signal transduction histidine kinase